MQSSPALQRQPKILVVDDNEDDVLLAKHTFQLSGLDVQIHAVADGVEGLQFLRHQPPYADAPRPDLILLDLNMPKMDGREMLGVLKSDDELCSIPTVILTTSESDSDVHNAYHSHANGYVTKPMGLDEFSGIVQGLYKFWFDVARLPNVPRPR
jgi:two-component system response regulator